VTDIRATIAASIFSEMKTRLQGMSKLAQSDMMFKKYHLDAVEAVINCTATIPPDATIY
jgi:hypothetical protein